ncbi:hypothetical protein BANRA_00002 [Klebsiella pneumoniae]|nr:hypothetical protein BANRA_00002 [Klebsiella pneumoniae]
MHIASPILPPAPPGVHVRDKRALQHRQQPKSIFCRCGNGSLPLVQRDRFGGKRVGGVHRRHALKVDMGAGKLRGNEVDVIFHRADDRSPSPPPGRPRSLVSRISFWIHSRLTIGTTSRSDAWLATSCCGVTTPPCSPHRTARLSAPAAAARSPAPDSTARLRHRCGDISATDAVATIVDRSAPAGRSRSPPGQSS